MVRTLKDLAVSTIGDGDTAGIQGTTHSSAYHQSIRNFSLDGSSTKYKEKMTFDSMKVCHIPTLPLADAALAMIQRVCKEFEPIIKRRQYNVRSISEMCCCNDGLDFEEERLRRRHRKHKLMNDNVWGYNQTTWRGGGKSHTIHLRLRHSRSHDRLLLYEDVAGTLAHELAHCEIGPHNDKFNKLMDEILEEHMMLQCKNAGGSPSFTPFSGQGVVLHSDEDDNGRDKTIGLGPHHGGYKLGGDNKFTKWLSPGEAACMAAEARRRQQNLRLRGNHCCQPVTITISDDEGKESTVESDSNPTSGKHRDTIVERKRRPAEIDAGKSKNLAVACKTSMQSGTNRVNSLEKQKPQIVDLTVDDPISSKKYRRNDITAPGSWAVITMEEGSKCSISSSPDEWPCQRCTFINQVMASACSMCNMEKRLG